MTGAPLAGAAVRHLWTLDPDWLSLNHGSYGATPRAVLAEQQEWRRRMEEQPGRFFRRELTPALEAAAARLAAMIGAEAQDLAFVDNATSGCNAVLRSLAFRQGDEIVVLSHGYGAVRNAARFAAARAGAHVVEADLPFPRPEPADAVAAVKAALTPRTRLAVLDHVTSPSALVLPVREMAAACRAAGVAVLVDGAHAPGMLPLDVQAIGADWYAGNCHKWLCAPKGSGFLWAARERQAELHPPVISHGFDKGFRAEFDWTGTRDPSAWLAVPAAIDFHRSLGGEALMTRNAALAAEAGAMLAARLGTETGAAGLGGAMATVRLPLAGEVTPARAEAFREELTDAGADVPVHAIGGAAWLRVSVFAYNEMTEYERLAEMVNRLD